MSTLRLLETCLYARDLKSAERFYTDVMGLSVASRFDDGIVFRVGEGVLIVFDPESTTSPERNVPPHGATGEGHVAFTVSDDELAAWRERLGERHVEIEAEVEWKGRGTSIYFRDPAGNLVELAPSGLWG